MATFYLQVSAGEALRAGACATDAVGQPAALPARLRTLQRLWKHTGLHPRAPSRCGYSVLACLRSLSFLCRAGEG